MVEGIPSIKFFKGTCKGCIVEKRVERKYGKRKERREIQVVDMIHPNLIGPLPTMS